MALSFPDTPTVNQEYLASNGVTYRFDGTKWILIPAESLPLQAVVSATAPTAPKNGDLWYNTTDETLYIYYNDWVVQSGAGGLAWGALATNATAESMSGYLMSGNITLTLPASPEIGDQVGWKNISGTQTIARNGSNIEGDASDLVIDIAGAGGLFVYQGVTSGWVNVTEVNASSFGVYTAATAPATPTDGQLWWDTTDGTLYFYYNDGSSSQWVSVTAGAGPEFASQAEALAGTEAGKVMSPATTHATIYQPETTLYVRPPADGGSNANNGTSWATPFATIQHAINSLRKHLTGTVIIFVGPGDYSADGPIDISYFHGDWLLILATSDGVTSETTLASAANYLVAGVSISNCSSVIQLRCFRSSGEPGFLVENSNALLRCCDTINTASIGFRINYDGYAYIYDGSRASNKTGGALYLTNGSRCYSRDWDAGTGNAFGIRSFQSMVFKLGAQPSGTTAEQTSSGGQIW